MSEDNPRDTLGNTLRKARESRGLSLDQVSSATKIHVKILQDLEMDRYDELPAEPFTRGFIYNYARFLGLSPQKIFEDFKSFLDEKWKRALSRSRGIRGYAFERPEGEQSRRMLWAIMVGLFILGILVIVVFKPSLKHKRGHVDQLKTEATPLSAATPVVIPTPNPTVSLVAIVVTQSPAVVASPVVVPSKLPMVTPLIIPLPTIGAVQPTPILKVSPTPAVIAFTQTTANRADQLQNGSDYEPATVKRKFIFKALVDVTVQYKCDDKTLMKFTLRKDRILVLRGKDMIRLQVSNPRSIGVSLGAKGYVPLSESKRLFKYNDTATFVDPLEIKEKMAEKWDGATALSETADPAPEAAEASDSAPVTESNPALSPTP